MRMRVVTFNVQNTSAADPARLRMINTMLRELEPDVVSLQEVMSNDHLEALLHGTGLTGTHQSDHLAYEMPFVDQYGGTAVATRWPHEVVEVADQRLTDAPDVPWCSIAVVITLPGVGEQLIIATTSSWRLDAEAARERQALALADLDARHRRELPTVIAGDLNADADASSVRFLTGRQSLVGRSVCYHDAWVVGGDGPGHTWTDVNGAAAEEMAAVVRQPRHRRRLDYILVGSWHNHPEARAEVHAASLIGDEPVDGTWPSDHFGVTADLQVERNS